MACNCIKTTEEKLIELFEKTNHEPETKVIEGKYVNRGMSFGAGGGWRLYVPFKINYTFKKVNGTTSAPKSTTHSMYFSYCPFCGKSLKESKEEEATDAKG